jgi:hypothetical protein
MKALHTRRPPLRRAGTRLAMLMLGLALVVGVVRAGSHCFYCPLMDAVVSEHCCPTEAPEQTPAAREPDCCKAMTLSGPQLARVVTPRPELAPPLLLGTVLRAAVVGHGRFPPTRLAMVRSGLSPPGSSSSSRRLILRI